MILVDTNLLLYMYDPLDPVKQAQAISISHALQEKGRGCLSAQILAEFCHAGIRKLRLNRGFIVEQVAFFTNSWRILDLTPAVVFEAARGVRDHSLAYYDAQIWATAKLNQIPVLFSEDFNAGATLEGVRFINPFAESFQLDDWV